jgi:hypothetical protein
VTHGNQRTLDRFLTRKQQLPKRAEGAAGEAPAAIELLSDAE